MGKQQVIPTSCKTWSRLVLGVRISDILPDIVKAGARSEDFMYMLVDLMSAVWEDKCVPQEWVDAILVPIPKKGNLHCCDNWRDIALLDAVEKLAARIIQNKLQSI